MAVTPVTEVVQSPHVLKVFIVPDKRKGTPVFRWGQIEQPAATATGSILLSGQIAYRMSELLVAYSNMRSDIDFNSIDYQLSQDPREPQVICHSAAMYAAGLVNYPGQHGHFAEAYRGLEEMLTYEEQKPPAVVHLLREKISPAVIHKANERICPHTVLYIGDLRGEKVCFQKHSFGAASIGFLRNAERKYGTQHRLWVNA